jgi:hypothetical protein
LDHDSSVHLQYMYSLTYSLEPVSPWMPAYPRLFIAFLLLPSLFFFIGSRRIQVPSSWPNGRPVCPTHSFSVLRYDTHRHDTSHDAPLSKFVPPRLKMSIHRHAEGYGTALMRLELKDNGFTDILLPSYYVPNKQYIVFACEKVNYVTV